MVGRSEMKFVCGYITSGGARSSGLRIRTYLSSMAPIAEVLVYQTPKENHAEHHCNPIYPERLLCHKIIFLEQKAEWNTAFQNWQLNKKDELAVEKECKNLEKELSDIYS